MAHEGVNHTQLTLPKDKPITISTELLFLSYRQWALRDFQGMPPDPHELIQYPRDWYEQNLTIAEIVKYVRDEMVMKQRNG